MPLHQKIEGKYVDVVHSEIYPARIYFDTHIRNIERISNAPDLFILPGLVDAHVHIESSMLLPSEFARMAVRHGTLATVSDPHEIANVLGVRGIEFMLEDASLVPFCFLFGAPSCVPATPFENTGTAVSVDDIDELFQKGKVGYLSEMMNYPGVIGYDPEIIAKIAVAHKYGKPVDGHAPGLMGEELKEYIRAGISTDHESDTLEEAEEKIRLGMKILIRDGSAAKNFDTLFPLIEKYPNKVMLCTDDLHPDDLLRGHINHLLAKGISKGVALFPLLRAATINPVEHYRIDLSLVREGDSADFIVTDNLRDFIVEKTFFRGACLFNRAGEPFEPGMPPKHFPNRFGAVKVSETDIAVTAATNKMKVITAMDGDLFTRQMICSVQIGTLVHANVSTDTLKIVVLNRYLPMKPAVAFIRGFGLKSGALASTVAHDSHHIIAVGCDDDSIVRAINHIIDLKGGLTAYYNKKIIDLKLEIAGLMSSNSGEKVALDYEELNKAASNMGCILTAPFMTLSFMALLVIPELKLAANGLFDVKEFRPTNLFID